MKPFNDVRVRKALSLALDRWEASETLSKIAIIKPVGGVMRPGSEFAPTEAELTGLVGYSKDIKGARKEARRLLKEAGVGRGT
jgi:peptide/nickel transport system substrate-binding protein